MSNRIICKLTDAFLEGKNIHKVAPYYLVSEAVIDATKMDEFLKSSTFKHIDKIAKEIFKYAEIDVKWRTYSGMTNKQGVELAIEYMFYVRNFLQSLHVQNFPSIVKRQIAASITTLKRSEGTAERKLKEAEAASTPLEGENILKAFPVTYFRRAIDALTDVFLAMGIPWDYDYDWQNYLKKAGDKSKEMGATYDAKGRRVVDYGVPEHVVRGYRNSILHAAKTSTLEAARSKAGNKALFDRLCEEMEVL